MATTARHAPRPRRQDPGRPGSETARRDAGGRGAGEPARRGPWIWFAALLRAPPAVTRRQWRLLGVVGAAHLFSNYSLGIMGLALHQIQVGLEVSEQSIGGVVAFVQLGVLPALGLTVLADRAGRRRLLLLTILGFALSTFFTAFAPGAREFMVLQLLTRVFVWGEWMLAVVVVAEEFDAENRGWGIGVLSAVGALGQGLVSILFSFVDVLPFGWRALYAVGALPLVLVPWFRRSLDETHRFVAHRESRPLERGAGAALQPLRNLARMYPGRMLALGAALFPAAFAIETAVFFPSKFLQEAHGYSPANVALLYLTVGALAPIGNVAAGALGDRFGRRLVMILGLLANAAAVALFYNAAGGWVPSAWGVMVFTFSMMQVLFAALGSELFPTSYRSTASGMRMVVWTVGFACGLWLEGRLYPLAGSHAAAITWMLVAAPLAPLIIALSLPETAARELEEIAPEKRVG